MQSADYVPGVSGWKFDPTTGEFELNSDVVSVSGIDPSARYCGRSRPASSEPFIVDEARVYIKQALIDEGAISGRDEELKEALARFTSSKPCLVDPHRFAVRMAKGSNGQYVCAGVGAGVDGEQKPASADEILQLLAKSISESRFGVELQSRVDAIESVRDAIRQELKPGGLLHRR